MTTSLFCLLLLLASRVSGAHNSCARSFVASFPDSSRGREVSVTLCLPNPRATVLLVFAHGGGLFAEDYAYVDSLSAHGTAVARLISSCDDPPCPADGLEPMALDLSFLTTTLLQQNAHNESSPLFQQLSPNAVCILAGHSMGAAAAVLAAATNFTRTTRLAGIIALAPGLFDQQQTCVVCHARYVVVRSLIIVGDQDCVPQSMLNTTPLPLFRNMTSAKEKALVVVTGANHCGWSSPVKGDCTWDGNCGDMARPEQEALALSLISAFTATLSGSWAAFSASLEAGRLRKEWQYLTEASDHAATLHDRCANCTNATISG
jgi:pimeloyl-ACP methyl ester carboxylesterase